MMLEDVLGWAAVLVGSALIWITKQPIIDPILSLCVAVYILWHAFANIRSVMLVLLERAPADFDTAAYRQALEEYERRSCTRIGRLIARREIPVLKKAGEILNIR